MSAAEELELLLGEFDIDPDDLEEGDLEGLGRLFKRRARRRRRLPGVTSTITPYGRVATPDLSQVSFPWAHIDMLALRPSGFTKQDFEAALRNSVAASEAYKLTARGTFTGVVANQTAAVQFTTTNYVFVGLRMTWDKSVAANSIIAQMFQAERYPISGDVQVRLEALFGSQEEWIPIVRLLVPNEPLRIALTTEGTPGAAHNVDFAYHGFLVRSPKEK